MHTKEGVFVQEEILSLLIKRLLDFKKRYRQNIAIIGREGTGKTTLVHYLLNNLSCLVKDSKEEKGIIPLYLEFKRGFSFEHLSIQFIRKLLFSFLKTKKEFSSEEKDFSLDSLIQQSQPYLSLTISTILQIKTYLAEKKNDLAYSSLLKLPYLLTQETGTKMVIFLDEFHYLGYLKLSAPFSGLTKEIVIQKDVLYILISSAVNLSREILSQKLSLLLGSFEIVNVEPFDFCTARKFLRQRNKWITFSPLCRDFILVFTDGSPFYLSTISRKIRLLSQESRVSNISFSLLERCLYEELFSEEGEINRYFSRKIENIKNHHFENLACVLFSLAEGDKRISEIVKKTGKKRKEVSRQLFYLVKKDIVFKNSRFYLLQDPLLKFWLNSSYRLKQDDPSFNLEYAKQRFLNNLKDVFQGFTSESKKDVLERVRELLICWKNESLLIKGKRIKLPQFLQVNLRIVFFKGQNTGYERKVLLAQTKEGRYWVGEVRREKVSPSLIEEFTELCRQISAEYKITRRFIVALKDVEIDAKILAKERKIWILTLKDLNFLLEFYNKPKVVMF